MAGFKVEGPARVVQFAGDGTSTYYVGQLVAFNTGSNAACYGGVTPLTTSSGAADTTGKHLVAGVVVGFNQRNPTFDTTYNTSTIVSSVVTQSNLLARDWILNKGMYAIGDPQVLIDVAMVDPTTLLEGPIYDAAYGTGLTVTYDDNGADTTGYTAAGSQGTTGFATPVTKMNTIYCRTGANAGLYRTTVDASATDPQVTVAFPYDVGLNDSFVRVPFKQGQAWLAIDTPGMYINAGFTPSTTASYMCIIEKLDLSTAGKEHAIFRFSPLHFDNARA